MSNISPTLSPDTQARLFSIADQRALKYAQEYQWTTWHPWNIVNDSDHDRRYSIRGINRHFLSLTEPFGSCLGASTNVFTELQAKMTKNSDLVVRRYANYVQLMTPAEHATSDIGHHAVVAMCFVICYRH